MKLDAGFVIDGKYAVERQLRQTTTRTTYLTRHLHIDLMLEIDILGSREATDRRRFGDEADLLSRFDVRGFHGFGVMEGDHVYMSFKPRPGRLLSQLLPVPPAQAAAHVRALAAHVADVHAKGIVIRVLRPDCVLVCDDGSAQIVDFGHAAVGNDPSVDMHALGCLLVELTGSAKRLAEALAPVPEVRAPEKNPFDW